MGSEMCIRDRFENTNRDNFSNDMQSDSEAETSEKFEREDDIPFIPTKVEVVDSGEAKTKEPSRTESASRREFLKIRRELFAILEFKVNLATKQKQEMQAKYQKLQTKFSWLVVSQMILFFVTIGCLSSLTQVQLKISNCLLYTSPSPRDLSTSRMPSSA